MTRAFTARSIALLALAFLSCNEAADEASPRLSTQKKKLDAKALVAMGAPCDSALQPLLLVVPAEDAPQAAVKFEGKELQCGESYELVVSGPDGDSTSESLVADMTGTVESAHPFDGQSGERQATLYDSNGEQVAHVLSHNNVFRYGHLTWRQVGPRTAEFSALSAFRRSYAGSGPDGLVVTGDTFRETAGATILCFGEGSCTDALTYQVTSHNVAQGWVIARAVTSSQPQKMPGTGVTVTETEPNNSITSANTMQLGDDYLSDISSSGESDYVRFTLSQRTGVEMRTSLVTMGDSYLYLYNSTGTMLAYNDDGGGGLTSLITITLDAGTYYIRAAGFGSSTGRQYVQLREMRTAPPGPITRTYTSNGPFRASLSGCCRLNTQNNYIVRSVVSFTAPNSSPVSTLSPIVDAPANQAGFSFQIPATDAEGDQLTFRLATDSESGIYTPLYGMTVSSTGLVRWSTVGATLGALWPVQIIIEEHRNGVLIGSTAVDFLLRITSATGTAPTCLPPPQTSYTVNAGQPLQFTVGTRDPDANDTLRLTGSGLPPGALMQPVLPLQGASGISSTFSWTPPSSAAGTMYQMIFTVTDLAGLTGQCTLQVTVQSASSNLPPVANAGPDQTVSEGATVALSGTGSSDPDGGALTYRWSFVSSTGPAVTLSSTTSATPSFTTADDGLYTLLLTVTDSQGASGSDTVVVRVNNVAPQLSLDTSDGQINEGSFFNATGSFTDPGADSFSATVDYGDGSGVRSLPLTNRAFTLRHQYPDNGLFQARVVITDDNGGQGTFTVPVLVLNVAPVFVNVPTGFEVSEGERLPGSFTFFDPGMDAWQVWVEFGNGDIAYRLPWSQELAFDYGYPLAGTYTITITLRDDEGAEATATIPVVVHNVAPLVGLYTEQVFLAEGEPLSSGGGFYDPGFGRDTFTVTVDYGDGTGPQPLELWGSDFNLWHHYADNGTYLVTVTVTDGFGSVGTASMQVIVQNVAPWVDLYTWAYFQEGTRSLFEASIQDPGSQDTLTATVDYGDGSPVQPVEVTSNLVEFSHVYADDGWYQVTLTVTDDDGGVGMASTWVYVENLIPEVSIATEVEILEGSVLQLPGSFIDPGADTWTAEVHYGEEYGSFETLPLDGKTFQLNHRYAMSGWYYVNIWIHDGDGGWGHALVAVHVQNVAPEVTVTGGEALEGSLFTGSGSFTDPGWEHWWYALADYGDGTGLHWLEINDNSFTLEHTYSDNGVFPVTVYVYDSDHYYSGGVGIATTQAVIHNVAPSVVSQGGTINEGETFGAYAYVTEQGFRDSLMAQIDYGDGSPVETRFNFWHEFQWSHRYRDNGIYMVTISVIDDDGGIGTTTVPVEVLNIAPYFGFGIYGEGEGSVYRANGSVLDAGDDTWTITLDYGDGLGPQEIPTHPGDPSRFSATHIYDDNGFYLVTLTITDDDGGVSSRQETIWVQNVAPRVTVANDSPRPWGVPVHFVGTAIDPSQADTEAGFESIWFLGDNTTAQGLTTAHAYAAPGTYWARLQVTDKDGGFTYPNYTFARIHKRPSAVTCADMTAVFGFPVELSAQFVDGLAGGALGGRYLTFRLAGLTMPVSVPTDASGLASLQGPGELAPGSYPITVTFTEDPLYTAAQASCTLTVTQSNGTITGGAMRFANRSRGGFNVRLAEGGSVQGELQFQNDTTSFHASVMTALGLSANKRQGWFAGTGRDGRAFTAYLEDNGEPGSSDVFKLWLDGTLQTGDGVLDGGNIQIH